MSVGTVAECKVIGSLRIGRTGGASECDNIVVVGRSSARDRVGVWAGKWGKCDYAEESNFKFVHIQKNNSNNNKWKTIILKAHK